MAFTVEWITPDVAILRGGDKDFTHGDEPSWVMTVKREGDLARCKALMARNGEPIFTASTAIEMMRSIGVTGYWRERYHRGRHTELERAPLKNLRTLSKS